MVQRGYRTLFGDLLEDTEVKAPQGKGRNEELLAQRNELLIHRYYYFTKILRLQYGDALKQLRDQLHLETRTITDILQTNSAELYRLHQSKPAIKYFRDKYPYLRWD